MIKFKPAWAVLLFLGLFVSYKSASAAVAAPFYYTFNSDGVLQETGSSQESSSPYFWINSGGQLPIASGVGGTMQGTAPTGSLWRKLYAVSNPLDTDLGLHPQNIFRLVTKSQWQNVREQAYFKVVSDNLSTSPNRNSSNGLLLFSRYYDSQNVYYAGLRVDGAAVIKKKINGTYYTLAYQKILSGAYDTSVSPNLLPKNSWIGLRTETVNNSDGSVTIKLYSDMAGNGAWNLILQAKDDGKSYGGKALTNAASGGIRTDFMDVQFDNYKLENM